MDETSWGVKGVKEWLWIVANRDFALFHAADTRSRAELETLLGLSYDGVLSSDDYSVYNGYDVKAQQKCLAHLRRHFKKLIQLPGLNNREIGKKFVKLIDEAFKHDARSLVTPSQRARGGKTVKTALALCEIFTNDGDLQYTL